MNVLFPLLAAVLQASSYTLDKAILSIRRIGYATYVGASFPLMFVITGVIFFVMRPPLTEELFAGRMGWFILLSVLASVVSNILYYRALKDDTLQEMQALNLLGAIPVIIITSLLFSDERNVYVLVSAFVATVAIVWSHWDHHRIHIAKRTMPFVVWSLAISPLGAPISKVLLTAWDPISLELVRSGAMALFFLPYTTKAIGSLEFRSWMLILLTNALSAVAWILFFASFKYSGVVYTMLLFSLQPILVYLASIVFLREGFHWKKTIAFAVILVAVGVAQLMA